MIELKGSQGQINWASKIREEKYTILSEYANELESEMRLAGQIVPSQNIVEKIFKRHSFAQWWIENNNSVLKYLSEEFDKEIQNFLVSFDPVNITEALVIFDLHDTLSNVPFIDKKPLHALPGRKDKLQELKKAGKILACAANYGGVARGYVSEKEAYEEVKPVMRELGMNICTLSFGYPNPIEGKEMYQSADQLSRRKPEPGMFLDLLKKYQLDASQAVAIGDAEEDEQAAVKANIRFVWSGEYF